MTTTERLRELERAATDKLLRPEDGTAYNFDAAYREETLAKDAFRDAVINALPAMLAVIEAAEKAEKFIGSLKRWECSTGLESDAFPLHQELRNTLAAFREVRE